MKIIVHRGFGMFSGNDCLVEAWNKTMPKLKVDYGFELSDYRTHPELINLIEHSEVLAGSLSIVEIPDNVTDWMISDYDGAESVIYVVEGKLHRA